VTKAGKIKCRKHDSEVDIVGGDGCPDPDSPCKYRSGCIIHAYSEEKSKSKKRLKPRGYCK